MRRRVTALLTAGILGAAAFPAAAGSRTSAFAPIDPGVRATAMAGAYTALGGEPIALYWNPATLFYQEGRSLEASYSDLYGLGLARRTFLTMGYKSVIEEPRFSQDRVIVRTDRESGPAYAFGIQSLFVDVGDNGYSELSLGGGSAWGYGERLAVGLAVRTLFVSSDLDDVGAFGYNIGFGVAWRHSQNERLGLSIPHLLSRVFWTFESTERLPLGVSLGWTRKFPRGAQVCVEAEWREEESGPYRIAAGGEWWIVPERLAFRIGFRHLAGDLESVNKPTFGTGIQFSRLRFDDAFRLEPSALGDTHRMGLLIGF
jgi:hypothetical protein